MDRGRTRLISSTRVLKAADNAMSFKTTVRTIANQYGLCASFLPKPLRDESGNGLHINLSIERGGINIFEQQDGQLSLDAQHAIAGILGRIREISLFLNPLPSSYQRLGCWEAPKRINWSFGNRTSLPHSSGASPARVVPARPCLQPVSGVRAGAGGGHGGHHRR